MMTVKMERKKMRKYDIITNDLGNIYRSSNKTITYA